jgi:hypothetical protein
MSTFYTNLADGPISLLSRPLRAAGLALAMIIVAATAVDAQSRGNFDDADANHDGHVTLQEFEAYATKRLMSANGPMAQQFKKLSPTEQTARLQQRFETLDHGHKGYLDRNDWDSAESPVREPAGRRLGVPNKGLTLGGGISAVDPAHYQATNPVFSWSALGGRFAVALRPSLLWFSSPQGSGSVRVQRLSLAYSFSPSMTLSTLTQYDNASGHVTANTLYQWIIAPNRTLFVVWNHGSTPNPNLLQGGRTVGGDSAIVKLSWGFY